MPKQFLSRLRTLPRPGAPSLRSFRGVDASHAALALAAAPGLFPAGSHVELVEMDMLMFLESCETASCHIVLSSFAIHHLLTPDKARLLRQVHRVLAPGGTLLYADVYNSVPGEQGLAGRRGPPTRVASCSLAGAGVADPSTTPRT